MTPIDLDAIQARAEAATEGPWEADGGSVSQALTRPEPWAEVVTQEVSCMSYCLGGSTRGILHEADAAFIAHAREDVPALVAEVRKLHQLVARVLNLASFGGQIEAAIHEAGYWRHELQASRGERRPSIREDAS